VRTFLCGERSSTKAVRGRRGGSAASEGHHGEVTRTAVSRENKSGVLVRAMGMKGEHSVWQPVAVKAGRQQRERHACTGAFLAPRAAPVKRL